MADVIAIGSPPWTNDRLLDGLEEFAALYEGRPIRDNAGGMASPHMFFAWFIMRELRPQVIVESGVWMGQGTWLFEQACPDAELICIEPYPATIRYRSARARYVERDFTKLDWSAVSREETVLFFDDHQNAFERVKSAMSLGFRHLVFEDNYPPGRGDCYSLKKVFSRTGFRAEPLPHATAGDRLQRLVARVIGRERTSQDVAPNPADADFLWKHLDTYVELPPVFRPEITRWGDSWSEESYPTPPPLLERVEAPFQQIFRDEAAAYTWMCYARLNAPITAERYHQKAPLFDGGANTDARG